MAVVGMQGVDFENGRLVAPAIETDGEFEIGWYDMIADTLYLVVNRAGRERIERHDIATGDLLQASTEGFVDFDVPRRRPRAPGPRMDASSSSTRAVVGAARDAVSGELSRSTA